MTRTSTRLVRLVAAAGITGLALAGCSSSDPVPAPAPTDTAAASPAALLSEAADATAEAGSARIVSKTTLVAGEYTTTIDAKGVTNFETQQLDLTMSMDVLGQSLDVAVIVDGGKTYVKMAMLGDKWVEAPAQEVGVNYSDPASALEQLKDVADLQEVGQEDVNGVPATKYTGTVDIREALGQAGLNDEQRAELEKELDKVNIDTADVTVWVDAEGRVVRMDQDMEFDLGTAAPTGMGGGAMKMTSSTTFSDFGLATDITPPPADQITQAPDLSGLTGASPTPSS